MKVGIIGGQMVYQRLTLQLLKEDEAKYEEAKAVIWLHMLNRFQEPTRWLKPNKNGTKVNFNAISTQLEYDKALAVLEVHINHINEKHGLDLKLNKK